MKIKELYSKKRFNSIDEAADFFGINKYAILLNLQGRKKLVANQYKFTYIKQRKNKESDNK